MVHLVRLDMPVPRVGGGETRAIKCGSAATNDTCMRGVLLLTLDK